MRRIPVLLVAIAMMAATLPSVASAHPAMRISDDRTSLSCDFIGNEQGTIILYVDVSREYGTAATLIYWDPSVIPDEAPPTWYSADAQVDLAEDRSSLAVAFDMYEFTEEPMAAAVPEPDPALFVGQADVIATLTPDGEPEDYGYRSQGTNRQERVEGFAQPLAVAGSATLPGGATFDLSGCYAVHESYSYFGTNPDAFVGRGEGVWVGCGWESEEYSIGLSAYREGEWSSVDLFVGDIGGQYYGYAEGAVVTDRQLAAEIVLYGEPEFGPEPAARAVGGPEEPVGSASVQASLQRTGERMRFTDRFGWDKMRSWVELLAVDGQLEVTWPGGSATLALDETSCSAEAFRYHVQSPTPNGRPHVKALANDLPENAEPISVGDAVSVRSTAGTQPEPEAQCTVVDPEFGESELPFGHTAWWTIEGTGGDVTVDTAGSDFDTALGVYLVDGGEFLQVACVDDVFVEPDAGSLQAAVTFAADAGASYLVQVGGFAGETGRLELAVR